MAARKTFGCHFYSINRVASFHSLRNFDQSLPKPPHVWPETSTSSGEKSFFRRFLHRRDMLKSGTRNSDGKSLFRRFLQRRAIFHSAASQDLFSLPFGDKLIEKMRGLNGDRIRLEGLVPPPMVTSPVERISVQDVRKLLQFAQLEKLKSALKHSPKNCVSYSEFVQICRDCIEGSSSEQAGRLAKLLDDSGSVIVLGDLVFLHPEEVAKAIESVVPISAPRPNDPRMTELKLMEKDKFEIDKKAETLVRRELWFGLGLLMIQTLGFMRLTFWELSWDVMEPICFFFTSVNVIAGYAFFLRTTREPSFEGFFENRFSTKQKRLMKLKSFDIERYNQLRKTCNPSLPPPPPPPRPCSCYPSSYDSRTPLGALQH